MNFKRGRPGKHRTACNCRNKALKDAGTPTMQEIRCTDYERPPQGTKKKKCEHAYRWEIPVNGTFAQTATRRPVYVQICQRCQKHAAYCLGISRWNPVCKCGNHTEEVGDGSGKA